MGGNFKFQVQDNFVEYFFFEIWRSKKRIALSGKKPPLIVLGYCFRELSLRKDIILNLYHSLTELALYVLSFLHPRDLLRAAQTCRYWRILAEDNLLWREKCREVREIVPIIILSIVSLKLFSKLCPKASLLKYRDRSTNTVGF